MLDQLETISTDEYREAWIEGEREAIICEFRDSAWGWGSGIQDLKPLNESEVIEVEPTSSDNLDILGNKVIGENSQF